jgi:hypothetical protein
MPAKTKMYDDSRHPHRDEVLRSGAHPNWSPPGHWPPGKVSHLRFRRWHSAQEFATELLAAAGWKFNLKRSGAPLPAAACCRRRLSKSLKSPASKKSNANDCTRAVRGSETTIQKHTGDVQRDPLTHHVPRTRCQALKRKKASTVFAQNQSWPRRTRRSWTRRPRCALRRMRR